MEEKERVLVGEVRVYWDSERKVHEKVQQPLSVTYHFNSALELVSFVVFVELFF